MDLLSSLYYLFFTIIDISILHYLIVNGGYSDIYVSDVIVPKSQIGVFKKLRKVATVFRRQ
jgi:hypothetical protein